MWIVYHLLDLCVVQAFIAYRRVMKHTNNIKKTWMKLVDFKLSVSDALMHQGKLAMSAKRGRPFIEDIGAELRRKAKKGPMAPLPQDIVRTDNVDQCTGRFLQRREDGARSRIVRGRQR